MMNRFTLLTIALILVHGMLPLQDGQDADLYRRKYVVELVSALLDGPSVGALTSSSDEVSFMLLGSMSSAAAVPSLAKFLVLQTGECNSGGER
jgi:hypothetical protein